MTVFSPSILHFVVPGSPGQRTGGYLYGARVVEELRAAGWSVSVHGLEGRFPEGDEEARSNLRSLLTRFQDGTSVVVDGLAMGGLPDPVREHGVRLRLVSLVHHPLAHETGLSPQDRERFRRSEVEALAPCRGVVVTSPFTRRQVEGMGVPRSRIRVVRPGTEPAAPSTGPLPGEAPRILSVGSVTPRKGQDVLVRALSRVHDLPWSCELVGGLDRDPEYVESVRAEVRHRRLEGRVRFTGELQEQELEARYRRSSLFVLPSYYEGYGMALTEALARGLPVVATTGGAVPQTVPEGVGVRVPAGDVDALAAALRPLLSEGGEGERDRMRRAALSHARSLPTWREAGEAFRAAVEELTALPAPQGWARG